MTTLSYTCDGLLEWVEDEGLAPAGHRYRVTHSGHFFQVVEFLDGPLPITFPCILDFGGRLATAVRVPDETAMRLAAEMHSALWNVARDRAEMDAGEDAAEWRAGMIETLESLSLDVETAIASLREDP